MFNKFSAIEDFINKALLRLFTALMKVISTYMPAKLAVALVRLKLLILTKKTLFVQKIKQKINNFKELLNRIKMSVLLSIDKFIQYSHQKEFNKWLTKLKTKILSTSPRQLFKEIFPHVRLFLLFIKSKTHKLLDSQNLVRALSVTLVVIGSVGIYISYNDIYKSENPNRSPASVQEYDYRPEYKTFENRTLKVMNMKIPVEVESVREINSITIDFSIRTTTRFSKLFLENYEYKLKDYFFTTVEPVISDFPLETEGKEVLKEKLTEEVNNFLRENAVEGTVEEIEIVFIVAS